MVSGQTVSERGLPGHVKTADAEEFPFDTGKRGASRWTGGRVNPSQRHGTAPKRLARSIASCVLERLGPTGSVGCYREFEWTCTTQEGGVIWSACLRATIHPGLHSTRTGG